MLTGWTLQMSCQVPKPRTRGVGDASNREMGVTFSGTMPYEAVISPSMIPGRHPQGGPDLPVHPYKANPRTLK